MRKIFFIPVLLMAGILCAALAQAAPDSPPDGLKMHKTKRTVVFNHSTHKKNMECTACHHPVQGKENFAKCSTAGCHDNVTDRTDTSKRGYHNVFHNVETTKMKTCNGCHLDVAAKNPAREQELTGCAESKCHP